MGIFSALRAARAVEEFAPLTAAEYTQPVATYGIRSPWSTAYLNPVLLADIYGADVEVPVTRAEAMGVPAVAKARHLIAGTISRLPLQAFRGAELVDPQPTWLYRTDSQTPPQLRMLWTLDDLIFGGWSLWSVARGSNGQVTDAVRIPPDLWSFDAVGNVVVDDRPVPADSVILFSGPFEGLLQAGARTIRGARDLEDTVANRAGAPVPMVELHQTTDDPLEESELTTLIDSWVTARKSKKGAVAYTPHNIEVRVHGSTATDLLIEGRNQTRIDVANLLGLPAAMLDGSLSTASLTYNTQQSRNNEFVDYGLRMWLDAVTSRLSMDDCVPRGQRVAFDLSDLISIPMNPTGAPVED